MIDTLSPTRSLEARANRAGGLPRFFRSGAVLLSLSILLLMIFVALAAPLIAPHPPDEARIGKSLKPISAEHWLGTDKEGRDIFSRILYGARSTLGGAALVVLISGLIGIPLGLISGFYGGWLDSLITRVWDLVLAFPPLLLAFVIVATFGRGPLTAVLALGIVYTPMISRVARSAALAERQKPYVEAARAVGSGNLRILALHIFPNCLTSLIVQATLDVGYAILDLAALSFLGLSVQPPTADWGAMLAHGQSYLFIAPNAALASGFCIMLAVVSFSLLGDGLAAYFDPRQRRGAGP